MFEIRDEDGQVISTHNTLAEAHAIAAHYRRNREMPSTHYAVWGPVAETQRQ